MAFRTMINLKQHGLLVRKYALTQNMSLSAKHAGVDRKTARKYVHSQASPDEQQKPHIWRTRPDPLAPVWPLAEGMLRDAPELEAKALFEHFLEQPESGLEPSHLRTFQRRVNHWRGTHGPDKEVFFPQHHSITINVACPDEQGDVESQNGHLKRRIKQHLLLRGNRDFAQEEDYDQFLEEVMEKANKPRLKRLAEELAVMSPLPCSALAEYREVDARVSRQSTIRVRKVVYSVPSRLIGQQLRVEVYESVLKLYLGRQAVLQLPRARSDRGAVINFRDVVAPLLRKPGAFLNYQHREQLYPTVAYREAYDRLVRDHGQRPGVIEYLHLLKLAIDHPVEKVEGAIVAWMVGTRKWGAAEVRASLVPAEVLTPLVAELAPDLDSYDQLISPQEEVTYVA